MTRLNVYAGPAGFWLVRGGKYDMVKDTSTGLPAVLPGPDPVAGQEVLALNIPGDPVRNSILEIPIVIQDRSFNEDGSLVCLTVLSCACSKLLLTSRSEAFRIFRRTLVRR